MAIVVRPSHQLLERRLNLGFDLGVDGARGLVEHEDGGICRDRTRE